MINFDINIYIYFRAVNIISFIVLYEKIIKCTNCSEKQWYFVDCKLLYRDYPTILCHCLELSFGPDQRRKNVLPIRLHCIVILPFALTFNLKDNFVSKLTFKKYTFR